MLYEILFDLIKPAKVIFYEEIWIEASIFNVILKMLLDLILKQTANECDNRFTVDLQWNVWNL